MINVNSDSFSNFSGNDFIISEYQEYLTLSEIPSRRKEKKFICPNCGEHHLSINADGKKYDCYGCHDQSAIAKKLIQLKKEATSTERKFKKPSQKREWIYLDKNNQPHIKVIRIDDGSGKKRIYQKAYVNGKWQKGFSENTSQSNCQLLYPDEIKKAIASNKPIFIVEGESCVDALRELGLTATTNIGGSGKNYQGYDVLKDYPNLVLCPDRDTQGLKHMETVAERLNHQPRWFYVPSQLWNNLDSSSGIDIEDFINEKKSEKLTNEQIKESIMNLVGDKKNFKTEAKVAERKIEPVIPDSDTAFNLIDGFVDRNLPESEIIKRLAKISQSTYIAVPILKDYLNQKLTEIENQELSLNLSFTVNNILEIENQDLNLYLVLPLSIATHLTSLAQKMKVAPEHLLTAILPTWASMIGTKSQIIISSAMGYTQPSILRAMLVADSGDRKTPILKNSTSAIVEMDKEAMRNYKRENRDYEEAVKGLKKGEKPPEEPIPTRYIMDDFNYDGAVRLHSENENGLLGIVDELKGYFTRMNKQTGKGDDEQKDLQLFNGSQIIKDRMSKAYSYYLPQSAISLVGTIQWDILGQLIKQKGDSDSAGTICRWLMCAKPLGQAKLNLFDGDDGLFDEIKTEQTDLLKYLRNLPKTDYLLSDSAKRLWQTFQHHLEDLRAVETIDALSVAYPKFESYMSRLALVLHCVESYYSGQKPSTTISGETMKRAIEMTQFYINQYRYVLAKVSPAQSLTGDILKIRDLLNKIQSLTVTQVKDRFKHLRTKDGRATILGYFETLVKSGFADWEKSRKKIRKNQDKNQEKSGQNQETPKTINLNALSETEKEKSGQVRTKSGNLKVNNSNGNGTKSGQNQDFNFYFQDSVSSINTENSTYSPDSVKYETNQETQEMNQENSTLVLNQETQEKNQETQEVSQENSTSVLNQETQEKNQESQEMSQENKIVTEVNCPEKYSKNSQDNDLSCPENVLSCPDENSEASNSNGFKCPENYPDFPENCPDFWNDGSEKDSEVSQSNDFICPENCPEKCPDFSENEKSQLREIYQLAELLGYDESILISLSYEYFFQDDLNKLNETEVKFLKRDLQGRAESRKLI